MTQLNPRPSAPQESSDPVEANRRWSERIIARWDPSFRHRWTVYNDLLRSLLTPDTVWVDVGCGENHVVEDLGSLAKIAVGVDPLPPARATTAPFIFADLRHLPFADASADLVTLRFVVEHLANIPGDFSEVERIVKPGGHLVILTTNTASPLIAIPRFLLPYRLKNFIIRTLFNVQENEIFPTHHRFNTPAAMRRGAGRLELVQLELVQDANWTRKPIFLFYFAWHLCTRPRRLKWLRMNIVAAFEKK